MHQASRPRGLLGTRGKAGLASTVGPVLVGVIFAFAWNMAGTRGPEVSQPDPGLAPTVGTAVDQAADQAWASVMPTATRLPDRRLNGVAAHRGAAAPLGSLWASLRIAIPTRDTKQRQGAGGGLH